MNIVVGTVTLWRPPHDTEIRTTQWWNITIIKSELKNKNTLSKKKSNTNI